MNTIRAKNKNRSRARSPQRSPQRTRSAKNNNGGNDEWWCTIDRSGVPRFYSRSSSSNRNSRISFIDVPKSVLENLKKTGCYTV